MLRRTAAGLATVVGLCIVPPARAQVLGCGDAGMPACAAGTQRRALVIGISQYPRLEASKQLRFADADARAFAGFLTAPDGPRLPADKVRLLVNDSATVPRILRELRALLRESQPGDVAIVYFAGHGTEEDGEAPRRAFLLASDAARQSELDVGGIEFSQLQGWLEKFVQKKVRIILVTDACRSGGMAVSEGYTRGAATALQQRFNGVTQLLSSDGDELSIEGEQWGDVRLGHGHGVYTWFLLEGLRGFAADTASGVVTLRTLQDYVQTQVRAATGGKQSPQHGGSLRDTLLTLPRATLAALRGKAAPAAGAAPTVVASRVTTRDVGSASTTSLDTVSRRLLRHLREAIVAGRLARTDPDDALTAYRALAVRPAARRILPSLREELVAAMQQDADELIHRYLEGGNDQPRAAAYRSAGELLTRAIGLLPATDPGRRALIARRDFLLGFAIYRANERSRFPEAQRLLRNTIAIEPRAAYAWNALGLLRSEVGDLREAERLYTAASAKAPRWQYPVNNLGVVHQERRDYTRAIASFRAAIALDTLGAMAYNNLGNVYASLGRYAAARFWYLRAIARQPGGHTARGNLAALYRKTGQRTLARAYLDTAFAVLQRDSMRADSTWTLLELGRLQLDQFDMPSADSTFARAAAAAPNRAEPLSYRGEVRRSMGDQAGAERFYRMAIARDARYAVAYNGLALLYRTGAGRDYTRALAALRDAARQLPASPEVAYYTGWLYQDWASDTSVPPAIRERAVGQAIASYTRTVQLDSLYGGVHESLAEVHEARGRWDDATTWYRRGVATNDSSADARFALARHLARRAVYDTAAGARWRQEERTVLQQLIAIDSAFTPAYQVLAMRELEAGQIDAAVTLLRTTAAQGVSGASLTASARALQLRGASRERLGDLLGAAQAYAGALSLDATMFDAAFGRARMLYRLQDSRVALTAIESLTVRARDEQERRDLSLLAAFTLVDLDEPARARDAIRRAVPRDTTFAPPAVYLARALAYAADARSASAEADRMQARRLAELNILAFRAKVLTAEDRERLLAGLSPRSTAVAQSLLQTASPGPSSPPSDSPPSDSSPSGTTR
ncbi:MAG: caspase family protein [Gemmatimonadaceae bacterium]|nr:caspase family protein [Gemmatimonadaceae bacterium]